MSRIVPNKQEVSTFAASEILILFKKALIKKKTTYFFESTVKYMDAFLWLLVRRKKINDGF